MHDVDENGMPTRVRGIKVGPKEELKEYDAVVMALDVPGIKKVLPESFRKYPMFDNIYNLDTVPIATVQVRFDGWVTEMEDEARYTCHSPCIHLSLTMYTSVTHYVYICHSLCIHPPG